LDVCVATASSAVISCTRRAALGSSCSDRGCVSYGSCDPSTQICVALGRVGDACVPPITGPTCLPGLQCATNVCAPPPPPAVCS
jgi:hypothetical protein